VITTDTLGAIVIINKVAEKLTGWTQSEAAGKPLIEVLKVINESTRQPCENLVEKVLSTGDSVELANHTILVSRDGTERIIADSGAPIKDADNKIIGVVLVIRDITEKQKLLDSAQQADKINAIGILAGGIAHDFNNLLCGIFGYIELAAESCISESQTADYLEKAMKTFARAKNLTYQLLTFAKGGVPVRKIGSLISVIRESTQFALSGSSTAALFTIPDDLWLCDFDENQFAQIIDNLVINAVQAMPWGGTITVNAENMEINQGENSSFKQGKYVHVSFADTGVGIPPAMLSRIFDPFFTTKQKGKGLGLATVYSIIKKHDGKITVNSEPGKGTTFHIYLPASEKTTATRTTGEAYAHRGTGRILIMDDEKYIREVVGDTLESMGYSIEYAVHGDEAIKMVDRAFRTKKPYVAAILDLTIPGRKGGKETIKQLKKIDQNLLTFVSSGYSEDPVMANPAEYGFTDRLVKPFTRTELAEMLDRHITSK
jgi:PAS domain S-box-containing protein